MKARTIRHRAGSAKPPTWRWLGAGLCLAAAFFAGKDSLARALAARNAELAHRLAPANPTIMARVATTRFLSMSGDRGRSQAVLLAREALRRDATTADALTVLGLDAQLRGDPAASRRFFKYSLLLTRRELRPRIFAIEEMVTRGDIAGALRSYDIALRTSSEAKTVLFPVLEAALREPRVRDALLDVMQTNPQWEDEFIETIVRGAHDPVAASMFLAEGNGGAINPSADAQAQMIESLARAGDYERAWLHYRRLRPGVQKNTSRDARFATNEPVQPLFDWRIASAPGLSATMGAFDGQSKLSFAVPSGWSGAIVEQTQMLPPGRYRLSGQSAGFDQPATSLPVWRVKCADGRVIAQIRVARSATQAERFSGDFTVPSACPLQLLSLEARPTDAIAGVAGEIRYTIVEPVRS